MTKWALRLLSLGLVVLAVYSLETGHASLDRGFWEMADTAIQQQATALYVLAKHGLQVVFFMLAALLSWMMSRSAGGDA